MSTKKSADILDKTINRRDLLKAAGVASAAGAMGLTFPPTGNAATGPSGRPNIVFILADDHRWDQMGFMGHPFLKTPALDKLASESVVFENAFVTTSLCSPSRASFLTGTYAHAHGVKNNLTPWTGQQTTLLEYLKRGGYDTGFIGKWHMPGKGLPELPFLDTFISFTIQDGQGRYYDCPLVVNGKQEKSRKEYITEELTDRAIEFVSRERKNPFVLYLSHKAVHHQFLPPRDLDGIYDHEKITMPKGYDPWLSMTDGNIYSGTMGLLSEHYRNYCETITGLDREVGRFLDTIDDLGLRDNTIVVYAGDNGFLWGEHRLIDKNWPYEESIRIPFMARFPGLVSDPGRRAPQMALNVDLAPTLLEVAGVPVPSDMEGKSLVPILSDKDAPGREAFLYEYFKDYPYNIPTTHAVRTKFYKYIEYVGRRKPELYNVTQDPKEEKNLMGTPEGDLVLPELKGMLEGLKAGLKS